MIGTLLNALWEGMQFGALAYTVWCVLKGRTAAKLVDEKLDDLNARTARLDGRFARLSISELREKVSALRARTTSVEKHAAANSADIQNIIAAVQTHKSAIMTLNGVILSNPLNQPEGAADDEASDTPA